MEEPKTDSQRMNEYNYGEVHLIEYVNVLLKRRWLIIGGVFLCVLVAGIVSKIMAPTFTASAKFLPSKNPEMVSRMGTLIGAGGGKLETLEDNVTSEYYAELLKSAPFLERIARKTFRSKNSEAGIDLFTYYKIKGNDEIQRLSRVIRAVSGSLKVSIDRTTKVIGLSYSTEERELSAAIVNSFLDELVVYNQDIKDTKAKQNRIFIENQVAENHTLLKKAEAELADFTARNKKIVTPELEIEFDRLKRSVKVQEEVYITLKKQLELAKIEEQEKKPVIEIIERAAPPLFKSKPRTKMNVILAGFLGGVMFVVLAFVVEFFSKSKANLEDKKYKEFYGHLNAIKRDVRSATRLFRKK
ncbi:MAG: Wzz/FepE/Etk N-terminal domain-containing protein [Clostridiales bacterium]|nr:Wzz/FepE/Etk N-terminal domain-containing protein [Clostridiales bacterium]